MGKKGPLQSPVKELQLIRQQLCSAQQQLPPPDVIHSPPFKINHSSLLLFQHFKMALLKRNER